jgi:hypothetical protein
MSNKAQDLGNLDCSLVNPTCSVMDSATYFDRHSVRRLLVTASVAPSSPILVTPMKEALSSFETPVLTRATRRNIPEDSILHNFLCHDS